MPRAPSDRPTRRLDGILSTLRRHGVVDFEASKLDGIGEGLKWRFGAMPRPATKHPELDPEPADPDLAPGASRPQPMDELALAQQDRMGIDGGEA